MCVPTPFDAFWSAYPRKENEKDAREAWDRLAPGPELAADIMVGLQRWMASEQWAVRRVIPHAATWLTKEKWSEYPSPARDRKNQDRHRQTRERLAEAAQRKPLDPQTIARALNNGPQPKGPPARCPGTSTAPPSRQSSAP